MGLTVHALNVGDIELDHSFTVWQTRVGIPVWAPTTAGLILGTGEPILVDSSFRSVEDARSEQYLNCRRSAEQSMERQLGKHGLRKLAREGKHILCTHDEEVFSLYPEGVK